MKVNWIYRKRELVTWYLIFAYTRKLLLICLYFTYWGYISIELEQLIHINSLQVIKITIYKYSRLACGSLAYLMDDWVNSPSSFFNLRMILINFLCVNNIASLSSILSFEKAFVSNLEASRAKPRLGLQPWSTISEFTAFGQRLMLKYSFFTSVTLQPCPGLRLYSTSHFHQANLLQPLIC